MEIIQLKIFVALVEEGNLKRAARRVSRSQPAVSMAMRRLEDEAGAALFRREQRGTYLLTPEGATLYCYALRLVRIYAEAVSAMERLHQGPKMKTSQKSRNALMKSTQ